MRKIKRVHRLNLELGPKSYQALEKLQSTLETSSQADTIRLALQTLSKLVDEMKDGAQVVIEHPDEGRTRVLLPLAQPASVDS